MQLDLLDYTPPKARRNTDTSRAAEKKIGPHKELLRDKVFAFIVSQDEQGATPDETALALNIDILNIRPRFTELKEAGMICTSGLRRQNSKGNTARVWLHA